MYDVHPRSAIAQPIAPFAVPVDENGFVDWLIDAKPGDKLVYYRGHLGHDRMPKAEVLDRQSRIILHAVANRVMAAASHGLVLPVQKRLGPNDYLYIAVKASRVRSTGRLTAPTPLPITNNAEVSSAALALAA